jgi:hypothetical protein
MQQGCQALMGKGGVRVCKAFGAGGLGGGYIGRIRGAMYVLHLTLVCNDLDQKADREALSNACAFFSHITQSVTQSTRCDDGCSQLGNLYSFLSPSNECLT